MDTPSQTEQSSIPTPSPTLPTEETSDDTGVNLYPIIRHLFLTVCILLAISIIVFLMYQNGKSIYDKGI